MTRWKSSVAHAFDAAVDSYDACADVQRQVARHLYHDIQHARQGKATRRILEIGCGTGALSGLLFALFPSACWLVTDIAPAMVATCAARYRETARCFDSSVTYGTMDGEDPAFAREWARRYGGFDVICSSLAFQWFADFPTALAGLRGLLAPGGQIVFTTLGAGSFGRWQAALAAAGLTVQGGNYPTLAQMRGWAGSSVRVQIFEQHFATGRDFLKMLSGLGADRQKANAGVVSPARLRRAVRLFEQDNPVADYSVFFVTCV